MRKSAVKRIEQGESPEAVAQGIGFNRRTIYRWLSNYHYGGEDALTAKPIPGAPQKLDAREMQQLSRIIREKNPLQLKFDYALWTLAIIRELIARRFKVKLSEVSVGRMMKRLGFSAQRPLYRAWQQDPALVQSWHDQEYPKIAARAKKEKALIFFADEFGIRSDHHAATTWGRPNSDTGGEFGDGRKSRALRHFDSRMRMSLRESRRFLIDNLSFHLILQSMDGHVTSIAPNRPDS
jgi:transposase